MQARTHGPERQVEGDRDFLIAEAVHVPQDDNDPLLAIQFADGAMQRRLHLRGLQRRARIRMRIGHSHQRRLSHPTGAARGFQPVQAEAGGDRIQPSGKLGLASKVPDGPVNAQEDLLGHFLGLAPIGEHPERDAEDPVLIGQYESLKRFRLPPPERFDQWSLVKAPVTGLDREGRGKFPLHSIIMGETKRARNFSCIIRLTRRGLRPPPSKMKIAILGGTGPEGAGLGLRWARAGHEIIIGSRDAARAQKKAAELGTKVKGASILGTANRDAALSAAVVVLTLPAHGLATTLPEVKEVCRGKLVVSAVVPLTFGGARLYTPPPIGSAAEEAQALLGPEAKVVAAFHHIAAHELASKHPIDCDLLLCGDDPAAKTIVAELGKSLGVRVLDVGPLANAGPLEGIAALLATINRRYKIKNSGIRITGI